MWSFAQAGVTVPRTSQAQANAGMPIDRADLEPGDIIVFYPNASHVGVYSGGGSGGNGNGFGKGGDGGNGGVYGAGGGGGGGGNTAGIGGDGGIGYTLLEWI